MKTIHFAVRVSDLERSLAETIERLTVAGLQPGEPELPDGPEGPKTFWLVDPDGYRIELVEWSPSGTPTFQ